MALGGQSRSICLGVDFLQLVPHLSCEECVPGLIEMYMVEKMTSVDLWMRRHVSDWGD